jgi:hypothetical protein
MGPRKLILSSLASAIVMLVLAISWHVAAASTYREEIAAVRETAHVDLIALGYLILGVMMAIIYPKGYSGGSPLLEGFRFGAMAGVMVGLPHNLVMHAVSQTLTANLVMADGAWHLVEQGVGGAVIGLVYGRHRVAEPTVDSSTD